ncbi:hypothetical protein BaRGS_00010538 [Batillaria attramentaria]|uniref:Uncharacterized protein n=1 Tax=Batillaria attramentaria TaxID=370345 RepID=A0ABD0LFU6_9CAEN
MLTTGSANASAGAVWLIAAAIRRGTAVDDTPLSSHKTLDSETLSSLISNANTGQSGNEDAMTMPTLSRL